MTVPPEPPGSPPPGPPEPLRPEFTVPRMSPVPPGAFDDPVARKRRMRLGTIGAAVGFGINILLVVVAVALGLSTTTTGPDQWVGAQIILLAGLVVAAPIQIVTGIVLAAVQRTRPFGVGFLIGTAIGIIVMAGACFAPLVATN